MKARLLIYLLVSFMLLFQLSNAVLACSGCMDCTWMDIENDLNAETIVVRGIGNHTSDYSGVSVLEYLVGAPSLPYLRVVYFGQGHGNAAVMGYYNGSCGSGAKYPIEEEAYYVMRRQADGTYRINHIITYPSEAEQFVHTSPAWEPYSLTEEEFLESIHANPQKPLYHEIEFPPLPMFYPSLIETEARSLYLVPVDIQATEELVPIAQNVQNVQHMDTFLGITTDDKLILHETLSGFKWEWDYPSGVDCLIVDCITFSNDGVIMSRQLDEDRIQLCELALIYPNSNYIEEPKSEEEPCRRNNHEALYTGQGVRFSSDNHYMAIWQDNGIRIYSGFSNFFALINEHNDNNAVLEASVNLNLPLDDESADWLAGRGIWSADNRWLAYSDSQGLWLWDIFTQSPQLFLATAEDGAIPYARFFSQSGRYLAVSMGEENFIMDRFSSLTFPDGMIRPDERILLRYDMVNGQDVPDEICSLLNGQCTPANEERYGDYYNRHTTQTFFPNHNWTDCYTSFTSPLESENFGVCTGVYKTGQYSFGVNMTYPLTINAESMLDSPIQWIRVLSME